MADKTPQSTSGVDCCRHREHSGCISEYVCPKCRTVWRRNSQGEWVKRQNKNPYLDSMQDAREPEDWSLPMEKFDEPWEVMPT